MDKNINNLKQNITLALRSVPNDKNFDEVYQDLIKVTKKINIIETKNQKRTEKKVDKFFQNWSTQNGAIVNQNINNTIGQDALQAIDELIQKEQDSLEEIKNKLRLSKDDYNDNIETLLG